MIVSDIAKKIRKRGFNWFIQRLKYEFRTPETFLGKKLLSILRLPYQLLNFFSSKDRKTFYLIYDLEVSPITFDFSWALLIAKARAEQYKLDNIHILIIMGPFHGLEGNKEYRDVIPYDSRRSRIYNILMPLCQLVNKPISFSFFNQREDASTLLKRAKYQYPEEYYLNLPVSHQTIDGVHYPYQSFSAPIYTKNHIEKWHKLHGHGKKILTITLRDYPFAKARNTNIQEWQQFIDTVDTEQYLIVCIPDTETIYHSLPQFKGVTYFNEASWNIGLRCALYEQAYLNLGVSGGPMSLLWFNEKTRYIMFKLHVDGPVQTSKEAMEKHGFSYGKSLPNANQFQKWVWQNDTFETIKSEFDKMVELIDNKELSTYG